MLTKNPEIIIYLKLARRLHLSMLLSYNQLTRDYLWNRNRHLFSMNTSLEDIVMETVKDPIKENVEKVVKDIFDLK